VRHDGIRVTGLSKSLGGTPVLNGVDLTVPAGRVCALMGANGVGKSTLMRILATTVLSDGGSATVDGFDVARHPRSVRGAIGVCLAEERSWYGQISGRRNLEFFAALHGLDRKQARLRADTLLADFDLSAAADLPFATYSTGMRLRVALGRALLHEPAVVLLDEPTRSLDPASSEEFIEKLLATARADGRAVLIITHDVGEARRCDSVAVMRDGVIGTLLEPPTTSALAAAVAA